VEEGIARAIDRRGEKEKQERNEAKVEPS